MRREFSAKRDRAYWLSREKSLAATSWTGPFDLAILEARLGNDVAMFNSVEKAYQQRSAELLYWGQTQPAFDHYRADSRFQNCVQRTGLAQ